MMLSTPRLLLRPWKLEDLPAFAALNADPEVMRYFPALRTREESDASARAASRALEARGWGLWAVERPGLAPFIGFIGLSEPDWTAPFTPCVEIGWRLARAHWGLGLAPEGAGAVVAHAFGTLGLAELVSFTSVVNTPSIRVMEKLGMTHDLGEDFDHPRMAEGHPLRRHVLFRLRRDGFRPS